GANAPLIPYVHQDNKDSTHYIGDFAQGGLGLPDRDYYLLPDEKFKDLRAKYQSHVEKMLTLGGIADPGKAASDIAALETRLAKVQWDKVDNRNPVKVYNKFPVARLAGLTRQIDWPGYLDAAGFKQLPAVIVSQPSYVNGLGKEIAATDLSTWKLY